MSLIQDREASQGPRRGWSHVWATRKPGSSRCDRLSFSQAPAERLAPSGACRPPRAGAHPTRAERPSQSQALPVRSLPTPATAHPVR